ncbi:MAG TPA: DsbA family protein [Caldilineae bacterium]|nr:DsbA family protein [Caldilineae bacterium]
MVFWGLIGLGILLIIALGAIGYVNSQKSKAAASEPGATIDERVGQPVDRTTIGDPNAPVLVETYEDFLCSHCADFTFELGPVLMELVKDGTVRWEYKYRVIGGADSYNANLAAECAADQGKFWEYHEELFRRIADQGKIAVFPKNLKKLAERMGLNGDQFNACLDKKEHLKEIQKIDQLAAARGVNGTPTIFINGQRYDGPRTPDAFRAAIAAAAQ